MDEELLVYRRQFLLSREPITDLSYWQHFVFPGDNYHLYAHPDLAVAVREKQENMCVLIGYIFDPSMPSKTNDQILSDTVSQGNSFESLVSSIKRYAGQYCLIYKDAASFNIIHDPLGTREIYYCDFPNKTICGSQPNLLKEYSSPPIVITSDKNKKDFFERDIKKVRRGRLSVGDETYFEGVKHLLPNHYLDLHSLKAKRYWPNNSIKKVTLEKAIDLCCQFLEGILKAASCRYDLMMAVTAGIDSRTLLAASRQISDKIYYFINKSPEMSPTHPDILISSNIFKTINIPFHIHTYSAEVDSRFREIYFHNVFMAAEFMLPVIYNIYYKQHQDKLNILGIGEIGRTFFGRRPRNLDGYFLARTLKYKDSEYAVEQCQKWLEETLPVAEKCGVDVMTLLLWEQLLGNWGAVGNSESDIAIDEFDPYNSHYLYEIMLGVDSKYRQSYHNRLFIGMIRNMWPELLQFPFNPPKKFRDRVRNWLVRLGLFEPIRNVIYKIDMLKFNLRKGKSRETNILHKL